MSLRDDLYAKGRRAQRNSRTWDSNDKAEFVIDALFAITEAIDELVARIEALEKKEV